jgi:hypothetical protein
MKLIKSKINRIVICTLALNGLLSGCITYKYESTTDTTKFYEDKLACETKYATGYDMFGNRTYGDIYKESPARDCMLAKGYKTAL